LLYRAPKLPPPNTLNKETGPPTGWYAQKPTYLLVAIGVILGLYWLIWGVQRWLGGRKVRRLR
jgi:hypothetical protein